MADKKTHPPSSAIAMDPLPAQGGSDRSPTGSSGNRGAPHLVSTLSSQSQPRSLVGAHRMPKSTQLRMRLNRYQIFCILISGVIGTHIFNGVGEALRLSGPLGLLLAMVFAGFVAICVGETISEMVQVFPVPNAAFNYVKYWLGDEDVAWAIGTLYWYSWATIFAQQMISAANLLGYWNPGPFWPCITFYFWVPLALVTLNLFPVDVFGWIETCGGIVKLAFIFAVTCIVFHISAITDSSDSSSPIYDGFQHDPAYAASPFRAFCFALPTIMVGYVGVESTMLAAYEAKSRTEIRWPSRCLHWVVATFYFFCTLGITLTVSWRNPKLPVPFGHTPLETHTAQRHLTRDARDSPSTTSPTILAIYGFRPDIAGVINGFLIFSVLSAGNSSLYYASRALWGLTYGLEGVNSISRRLRGLSVLMDRTGSPARAIIFTWIVFSWTPFLTLASFTATDVLQVLSLSSSLSCLIVWVSLLAAFLRYEKCTSSLGNDLSAQYRPYLRQEGHTYLANNFLLSLQPFTAWVGLVGVVLIFIIVSAMWWDTPATPAKVLAAYGAHIAVFLFILIIKCYRRRLLIWFDAHPCDVKSLEAVLNELEFLSDKFEFRRQISDPDNEDVIGEVTQ